MWGMHSISHITWVRHMVRWHHVMWYIIHAESNHFQTYDYLFLTNGIMSTSTKWVHSKWRTQSELKSSSISEFFPRLTDTFWAYTQIVLDFTPPHFWILKAKKYSTFSVHARIFEPTCTQTADRPAVSNQQSTTSKQQPTSNNQQSPINNEQATSSN